MSDEAAVPQLATAGGNASGATQAAAELPLERSADQQSKEESAQAAVVGNEVDDEDDSKETCGFCRFMKGGGCRAAFIAWSKCVDQEREAGTDFTEECREKTLALRECMLQHEDYYRPLLEEEEEAAAAAAAASAGVAEEQ